MRQLGSPELFVFSCRSEADKQSWVEAIEKQKNLIDNKPQRFVLKSMSPSLSKNVVGKINCTVPFANLLIIGCDNGLYLTSSDGSEPSKVLDVKNISQVDVVAENDILLVLSGKIIFSYSEIKI